MFLMGQLKEKIKTFLKTFEMFLAGSRLIFLSKLFQPFLRYFKKNNQNHEFFSTCSQSSSTYIYIMCNRNNNYKNIWERTSIWWSHGCVQSPNILFA